MENRTNGKQEYSLGASVIVGFVAAVVNVQSQRRRRGERRHRRVACDAKQHLELVSIF